MPREVVPIFRSPRRASDSTSSSRWYGRMMCAFSLISSRPSTLTPSRAELVDLLEQRLRIDDHAVADDAGDAGMQDARRDQVQDELRARRRRPCGRRCGRPDTARPRRSAASACRRSCPCLRRPTARRARRCWSSAFGYIQSHEARDRRAARIGTAHDGSVRIGSTFSRRRRTRGERVMILLRDFDDSRLVDSSRDSWSCGLNRRCTR